MDRLSRLNLSPQTRARFDDLIEEAPALGLRPETVAAAEAIRRMTGQGKQSQPSSSGKLGGRRG